MRTGSYTCGIDACGICHPNLRRLTASRPNPQDLYGFGLVLLRLMRLSEDGTPPCVVSAPRFSEPFEGWSMADLGDYVTHYRARVRAGSSACPPVN